MQKNKPNGNELPAILGVILYVIAFILIVLGVCGAILHALFSITPWHIVPLWISLWGIALGAFLMAFHTVIFRVPTYTVDDLILVLNSEWKTVLEISDELAQLKGVGDTFVDDHFRIPSSGWLSTTLDSLQAAGTVEVRFIPHYHKRRDRVLQIRQFRLTKSGLRKKDNVLEERKKRQARVLPLPETG